MTLALVRTSDWETPLFLHVLGSMLLVGGLFLASVSLVLAWRADAEGNVAVLTRFAYRVLFVVVLPAYIAMRIGAQWVLGNSPFQDSLSWVGIGFAISDLGAVVLLVALVVAGLGLRRADAGRGRTGARLVTVLSIVLLLAYLVAVWAMTTKPT